MRFKLPLLFTLFLALPARADRLKVGDWIGTGGMGFMSSPALFLISPHLEKVHRRNLFVGALVQAGFGSTGLFTVTATARMHIGNHPRLRPTLEGGLGISAGTAGFSSNIGVALHIGMGVDWLLDPDIAIGTIVRACFGPPVQTFFLSWPILQVRYFF